MSCGTALAFLSSKGFSGALCALPFRSRPPCPPSPPQRLQLMCGDENLCRCLCRLTSRVIQAALVAHKVWVGSTAIRLPIKTLPGSNYRTDIAITSVSSRLPRFGRIQTKSGPTTPPHVGSFRGPQGSPTDLLSCQPAPPGSPLLLADYPCLTSSHRDPSETLSSDRVKAGG